MKKFLCWLFCLFILVGCGKEKFSTDFDGKISPEILNGKVKLEITANVPDGAILETTLVGVKDNKPVFNVQNITIKEGKGEFIADVSDWGHGYISAMAMLRFNSDKIVQPKNVKSLYGEHGEKMTGFYTQENHLKGYNGILRYKRLAYPSFKILKSENEKNFYDTIFNTFKDVPKTLIHNIEVLELTESSIRIDVIVGGNWNYLSSKQKQQLTTQISSTLKNIAVANYQSSSTEMATVFFMSKSGNEVATPKAFGGYDIK